jgi:hypothetical protein
MTKRSVLGDLQFLTLQDLIRLIQSKELAEGLSSLGVSSNTILPFYFDLANHYKL